MDSPLQESKLANLWKEYLQHAPVYRGQYQHTGVHQGCQILAQNVWTGSLTH